jgi:hypothetical protein
MAKLNVSFMINADSFQKASLIENICKEYFINYQILSVGFQGSRGSSLSFPEPTKEELESLKKIKVTIVDDPTPQPPGTHIEKMIEENVVITDKVDASKIKVPTTKKKKKPVRKSMRKFTPESYQTIITRIRQVIGKKAKTVREIHTALNGEFARPYNTISSIMRRHDNELWISEKKGNSRVYLAV